MAEVKKQRLAEIGARIRERREGLGITQADMADCLAIRPESYNYIENGKRDMKTAELTQLAERLQVTTDYLLTGYAPENATTAKELQLTDKALTALKGMNERTAYIVNKLLEGAELADIAYFLSYYQIDMASALHYNDAPADKLEKLFLAPARASMQKVVALLEDTFKVKHVKDFYAEKRIPRKELEIKIENLLETLSKERLEEALELIEFVCQYNEGVFNEEAPEQ